MVKGGVKSYTNHISDIPSNTKGTVLVSMLKQSLKVEKTKAKKEKKRPIRDLAENGNDSQESRQNECSQDDRANQSAQSQSDELAETLQGCEKIFKQSAAGSSDSKSVQEE
eukprot:CAMPEP_0185569270 /NCGR_PEP_ID=MMETSP0434-20130131/1944_1 /TAXON_ID=626734 ORGANISM="Favella taraikaensis, Strain Fe Narragansett Bay" /NCGR_SAMPLE_ID=MMETSP0434 /ASSEMBLY_ACC=CAM_ASM_000379 /LENGTH=110 /DNA_ID=CAMNT_0028184005 /DNA_START=1190 /DNA_END=1522 /DNA_ORIENTATION=-